MKKVITILICIMMIMQTLLPMSAMAKSSGIPLPDINVTDKKNETNSDDTDTNTGDTSTNTGSDTESDSDTDTDSDSDTNIDQDTDSDGSSDDKDPGNDTEKDPENDTEKDPETDNSVKFENLVDIKETDWFYDEVKYAVENKIFAGTSPTTFEPLKTMTRAEFVQALVNLEKIDTSNKDVETVFSDVPSGKWYTPAVKWANENGIVSGVGDGSFAPDRTITREEMCGMLINYVAYKHIFLLKKEDMKEFADHAEISDWAINKVYPCQMADLVNGKGDNIFDPKATASRSEVVTLFKNFHEQYKASI